MHMEDRDQPWVSSLGIPSTSFEKESLIVSEVTVFVFLELGLQMCAPILYSIPQTGIVNVCHCTIQHPQNWDYRCVSLYCIASLELGSQMCATTVVQHVYMDSGGQAPLCLQGKH